MRNTIGCIFLQFCSLDRYNAKKVFDVENIKLISILPICTSTRTWKISCFRFIFYAHFSPEVKPNFFFEEKDTLFNFFSGSKLISLELNQKQRIFHVNKKIDQNLWQWRQISWTRRISSKEVISTIFINFKIRDSTLHLRSHMWWRKYQRLNTRRTLFLHSYRNFVGREIYTIGRLKSPYRCLKTNGIQLCLRCVLFWENKCLLSLCLLYTHAACPQ